MKNEDLSFVQPGDSVYHKEYGEGTIMQVQTAFALVNCKKTNQLKKLRISELSKNSPK